MTNRFEFDGRIGSVEDRQSKSGKPYFIVTVEGDDVGVPFTVFQPPPGEGIMVKVVGQLGSYNGYAKLEHCKIEVAGGSGISDLSEHRLAPKKKPKQVEITDDGDLPF